MKFLAVKFGSFDLIHTIISKHCRELKKSSSQPTSQPTNQPANQPTNQPTNQQTSYHPSN
jgi:hypothetical protein